jgi:hypothetical protein
MRESVLRDYLSGRVALTELLHDLEGTVEQLMPPGVRPVQTRYHIAPMDDEMQIDAGHLRKLIDAILGDELSLQQLDPISFCLEMSSRFHSNDTPEGDRVRMVVSWLANPDIDYRLTPDVLAKMKHYLATGEETFTAQDLAARPAAE